MENYLGASCIENACIKDLYSGAIYIENIYADRVVKYFGIYLQSHQIFKVWLFGKN